MNPATAVPVVSVAVYYDVGSRNEREGRTGFAHLFEHMMFQGSENVPKAGHFQYVFNNGGTMNGTTSSERTNYFETLPAGQLPLALWLESDRMRSLKVTQENLDNQREAVKEEKRLNYDNRPYSNAFLRLNDWQRFAFLAVPTGFLPALSLLAWRWQDRVARTFTLLTVANFLFFYVQAYVSLHYFVPGMVLPLVVFWRSELTGHLAPRWAVCTATAVAGLLGLALSLPNDFTRWSACVPDSAVPAYPIAYDAGKSLHAAARAAGRNGYGAQWAGQGAPLARAMPVHALMEALADELARARE